MKCVKCFYEYYRDDEKKMEAEFIFQGDSVCPFHLGTILGEFIKKVDKDGKD